MFLPVGQHASSTKKMKLMNLAGCFRFCGRSSLGVSAAIGGSLTTWIRKPAAMKASLIAWQVIMPAIWLYMVWRFLWKPWRREHRLTVDGLFLIAGTTCVFQDGMSNYFNHWITYNSYLVNWGSWYNDVPGWMAFGKPGQMYVEPPLFIPFAHGMAWLLFAMIGSKVIRAARAKWPAGTMTLHP